MEFFILPVASDGLNGTIVSAERNVESNDSVACLDQLQVLLGHVSLSCCSIEEEFNLFEEAGLLELVELGSEVGWVYA